MKVLLSLHIGRKKGEKMANRCTGIEVKEILDTTLTENEVAPFIIASNATVTAILGSSGLSTAQLKEIERWLAAHFAAIRDPRISREKTEGAEAIYHGKSNMGLDHTPYGQQVKLLDTTGTMTNLGKKKALVEMLDFLDGGT